jgi:hypothetical protein
VSEVAIITASAPDSSSFTTSYPSWAPVVAASEAVTRL